MPKIFINDQEFLVEEGKNLLHLALAKGFNIPYFCWHESLGSIGACRQCAVVQFKDENDKKGRLVMSCMTEAINNIRISTDHEDVISFRKNVIEWMMTNHPHDCPVCDEGGECHLQDMTMMTGHNYRRYRFKKRTFINQNLGPFIYHEMNRCIACYRCVRFYKDYAKGKDLDVFSSSNRVYFGKTENGPLKSEFSGNLVEVCPTGVFTDKVFRSQYVRKWDLQSSPAICQLCSLGCNIYPSERGNILRRITNRYHPKINGYFLCDTGRFGHNFVNLEKRMINSLEKGNIIEILKAKEKFFNKLSESKSIVAIGSSKASLEDNFALKKLVGAKNFFAGVDPKEWELITLIKQILEEGPNDIACLKDVEESDAILIVQEDILKTAPRLYLSAIQSQYFAIKKIGKSLNIPYWHDAALRNLSPEEKAPIWQLANEPNKLDEHAECSLKQTLEETLQFLLELFDAICHKDQSNPLALKLIKSQRPIIICGISHLDTQIVKASANIAKALYSIGINAKLHFVLPDVNSMGLALLDAQNLNLMPKNSDLGIVLKNNFLKYSMNFNDVVHIDFLKEPAEYLAYLSLACTSFVEETGTFVNNEGRAQRSYAVMPKKKEILESYQWCSKEEGDIDILIDELIKMQPIFSILKNGLYKKDLLFENQKIPRQHLGYSGRTAINANENIHEARVPIDSNSPLAFSMEGQGKDIPSDLMPKIWYPGFNSNQSIVKFQKRPGGDFINPGIEMLLIKPNKNEKIRFFPHQKEKKNHEKNNILGAI